MFEAILRQICRFDTIILHRHENPDGDALGSQIGLKHIILENFPQKTVLMVGDAAGRYAFMDDSAMDSVRDDVFEGALCVLLDTAAPKLISDNRYTLAASVARIDHHLMVEPIAPIEVIDTSFESCCGMVAALALEHALRVSPLAAQALYTGMVTDSGRFRYDSVSARTFRLAAFLMQSPIDTAALYRNLYQNDFETLKQRAEFTLRIRFTARGVAYVYTTADELRAQGGDGPALSRGMVNVMADIKGVDIWVSFTESERGVLCELRSSAYNINPVAVSFGGGGHPKASGATLKDHDEALRMLDALDALLDTAP